MLSEWRSFENATPTTLPFCAGNSTQGRYVCESAPHEGSTMWLAWRYFSCDTVLCVDASLSAHLPAQRALLHLRHGALFALSSSASPSGTGFAASRLHIREGGPSGVARVDCGVDLHREERVPTVRVRPAGGNAAKTRFVPSGERTTVHGERIRCTQKLKCGDEEREQSRARGGNPHRMSTRDTTPFVTEMLSPPTGYPTTTTESWSKKYSARTKGVT